MKTKLLTIGALSLGLAMTSPFTFAQDNPAAGAAPGAAQPAAPGGAAPAAGAKLSSGDEAFAKKAALGGLAEVQLGKLAQEKGGSQEVKDFGNMMVTDHSKANDELTALAGSKGLQLPTDLDAKHKATVDKLSKLSGAEFDKAYGHEMLKDHKEDVSEFEKASKSLKDPELKGFAEKTLPVLKTHLEKAQTLPGAEKGEGKKEKSEKKGGSEKKEKGA